MNLQQLFTMQKELDDFIAKTQNIEHDVFKEKGLALMVELAELANETRCFKFWSTKGTISARSNFRGVCGFNSLYFIARAT
ncbi:hypothetical protein LSPH24S_09404 [Lysinibacillus sphaericus]